MSKRVLIVGCGHVGLPLGQELVRQGHHVFGLRRSASQDPELKAPGLTPLCWNFWRSRRVASADLS